jgi:hypothetical protein
MPGTDMIRTYRLLTSQFSKYLCTIQELHCIQSNYIVLLSSNIIHTSNYIVLLSWIYVLKQVPNKS